MTVLLSTVYCRYALLFVPTSFILIPTSWPDKTEEGRFGQTSKLMDIRTDGPPNIWTSKLMDLQIDGHPNRLISKEIHHQTDASPYRCTSK